MAQALMMTLISAGMLCAQIERGIIAGTARDSSGAVMPSVTVTVRNVTTGIEVKTTTNAAGVYVMPNLIPGQYIVSAARTGFKTVVHPGVVLHADERIEVDLPMEVGQVSQQVEVTAEAPLLQSQSSSVSTVIPRQTLAELPLVGRSVFNVAPLVAGVTNGIAGLNANNTNIPDNARAPQGLSVNGLRQSANSYILDGVYNDEEDQGLMAILPPIEAIQEFKFETSNFMPEVGRGGGVMNVVLKSGTNQYHGELFEFFRNSALDARNFFDYTAPERLPHFEQNEFGGTFGGPIKKDKAFFFADYQDLRQILGESFVTLVPDANLRNGDFQGTAQEIFDPTTYNPATNTRQPFANQQIPASMFSPAAKNIMQYLPLPNGPILSFGQGEFFSTSPRTNNQKNFDVKVNYTISASDSFTGRWSFGNSHTVIPGAYTSLPQFAPAVGGTSGLAPGAGFLGGRVSNPSRSLALEEIHTFGPQTVNEFRAAYIRTGAIATQLNYGHDYATQVGIPNANVTNDNSGFPTMSISGFGPIGDSPFFPLTEVENVFEYLDNVTFIRGPHTFKTGADLRRIQRADTQILGDPAGGFSFGTDFTGDPANPGSTGNGFADFLLGIPDSGQLIRTSGLAGLRSWELGAYWEDTWKASRKLTLNYGIRYDLFTAPVEVYNRMSNFDVGTGKLLLPGMKGSDPNYNNRALMSTPLLNFSPRLGFAYRLSAKNVLRGGYGVFFMPESSAGFLMTLNPPFVGTLTYANVAVPQQINRTLDQGFPLVTNPFTPIDQFTGSINAYNPDGRTGYTQEYSLGIQHEFTPSLVWETYYVGNTSRDLQDLWNPNQPFPGTGNPILREPYGQVAPRLFSLTYQEQRAIGNYNSLQATLTKHFSRGLSFQANYTYSHAIEEPFSIVGIGSHQNNRDLNADIGNSGVDVRHRFVANEVYLLPFGRGQAFGSNASSVVNAFLGGWQLGGVQTIQTGMPFTVTGGAGRPNAVCNGNTPPGGHTISEWFNPDCYPLPAPVPDSVHGGVYIPFGNAGANTLFGPGLVDFDLTLSKQFKWHEDKAVEFRSEFFNAFNTPQFAQPQSAVNTGVTGRILAAGPAREIQLVLKFIF